MIASSTVKSVLTLCNCNVISISAGDLVESDLAVHEEIDRGLVGTSQYRVVCSSDSSVIDGHVEARVLRGFIGSKVSSPASIRLKSGSVL